MSERWENWEQHWGRRESIALGQAFSGWREAGERFAQPTSHDKRDLLTGSPCSRKELFWDPPAASQSRSWELGYFRGGTKSSSNSSVLDPSLTFVPGVLRGQVVLVGAVLLPSAWLPRGRQWQPGTIQHNLPYPQETTIAGSCG